MILWLTGNSFAMILPVSKLLFYLLPVLYLVYLKDCRPLDGPSRYCRPNEAARVYFLIVF